MLSRRELLLALGAGALGPRAVRAAAHAAPHTPGPVDLDDAPLGTSRAPLRGVGVQLYMLRQAMRADPERTLARIAELGYTEIEWWGNWGRTPQQLRATLDASGLRAPAAHIDPRDLQPDRLDALLDAAAAMGHATVIVAWMAPAQRDSAEAWQRTAALLSHAGHEAAKRGMRTGYHNHDFEFQRFGGRVGLEILMTETDPAVVDIELDCFWAFKAGHDPIALLERHRDRITMLHLKDSDGTPQHAQREVGRGVIDWPRLLTVALGGRVTNVFVEMDDPADAWASAGLGRAYLRTLGY